MVNELDSSGAGEVERLPKERRGRCPTCAQPTSWDGNPQRPFCSLTCRLVDLGLWLDEGYVVSDGPSDDVR